MRRIFVSLDSNAKLELLPDGRIRAELEGRFEPIQMSMELDTSTIDGPDGRDVQDTEPLTNYDLDLSHPSSGAKSYEPNEQDCPPILSGVRGRGEIDDVILFGSSDIPIACGSCGEIPDRLAGPKCRVCGRPRS